jgi:peptide/nickel transport system permease protein
VVAVILTAATFAFLALHLAPGDPASALVEGTPPEMRAQLRALYGFDQPLLVQYGRWLGALLRGDFGWSILARRPVAEVLATALPATMLLVLPAFLLSVVGGMLVGSWQAIWAGRRRDRITNLVLLVVYSMPEFWLALALVLLFARQWPLLPPNGMASDMAAYLSPAARVRDTLAHLVLPVLTLATVGIATFARYQRASLHDVLQQPFVRTATASGLARWRVWHGAWRASLRPVVTLGGLLLPAYLAGVVFIEQVFAWPGVGTVLVQATVARDYALVAGAVVLGSAITALASALAELLRDLLDPRARDAVQSSALPT